MLAAKLENVPVKALREIMDDVRSRLSENAVACLATAEDGKVGLLLYVSKDLHGRFTAPALIKDVAAPCGGSGGGRPDMLLALRATPPPATRTEYPPPCARSKTAAQPAALSPGR